ncbi:hypothetical protein EXA20_15880, partial [Vibrio cincinnatiensis]|nr:hypothetical protein [Vibrio cincinnatiensis]
LISTHFFPGTSHIETKTPRGIMGRILKFGDEVMVFMNDKCPAIATDLLKVIASIKNGSSHQ